MGGKCEDQEMSVVSNGSREKNAEAENTQCSPPRSGFVRFPL